MLSEEQRSFLMELQEELNTQDTVGQADPRFWVVRETVTDPCFDEDAEEWRIYDEDGYAVGHASCALEVEGHTCVPVHKVDRNAQNTMFLTLRGISHDQVLSAVMATKLYRQIGEPALQELNLSQAKAITRLLERWLEQAKTQTPRPRRVASTAPPAPLSKGTDHQTEEGNDQWI